MNFLDLGDEHPLDGFLDVVGHLVDDVVAADLDLLFLGERDGAVFGGDAEADDDGLRRVGQDDVALGDPADRLQEHADRDFLVLELFEFLDEGFDRALDVGLQDQVQALELLLGHLAVEVFERDGLAIGVGEVAGANPPGLGDVAGAGDVVDDAEVLAGAGDDVQTRDLHRRGRAGLLDRLALVVEEARTRPKPSPQTITSPTRRVPSWTSTEASTPRPSESEASRQVPVAGRVGSALSSCSSAIVSSVASRSGMPRPVDAEVLTTSVSPPHSAGFKPLLRELAVDLVDVGRSVDVGQVDLVERHHDRHAGRLGVGDGLDGLGHHAVVGGDDQDDDVGDVGASGTHRGECLVARAYRRT